MNLLKSLAEHAIRLAGPDAVNELLRSLMRDYEQLSYRRLRSLGFAPATIFDIGAHRGNWSRGARQIFPSAKIIMIEGQEELKPCLDEAAAHIGNATAYCCLLAGDDQKVVPFFSMGTGSSIKPERSNAAREVVWLATTTLDQISAIEGELPWPIFVKIDVQGAELDVLAGAKELMQRVEWFQLETALLPYNEEAPQLQEVCTFMADRGFLPTEITGFSRPKDHLVQVDLLFAREGSALRPSHFDF